MKCGVCLRPRASARRGAARAVASALLLLALPAAGAVRVELQSRTEGKDKTTRYVLWIDGPRLVAELARKGDAPPKRRILFRSDLDKVYLIQLDRQTYYQLDPESAKQAASQVAGLRQGLEQGLGTLTPDQRKAVEDLVGELAKPPSGPLPQYTLHPRGEKATYAEIGCAREDVLDGEKHVAELCMADYGPPPLVRERIAAVPALGGFLRRTLEPLVAQFPSLRPLLPYLTLAEAQGVPLYVRGGDEKGKRTETQVTRVGEAEAPAAIFELPQGYARSWIPPFR